MKTFLALMLCLGAAMSAVIVQMDQANNAVTAIEERETAWNEFKQRFERNYLGAEEESNRKAIFMSHLHEIIKHNLEADLGKHSYWQGINHFSDLTNAEFRARMNGLKKSTTPRNRTGSLFMAPENVMDVPTHVDWRKKGYVTPVKNQGQCGSCWSFSATGSLEGQHFRKSGKLVSLSEQNLVDCSRKEGNMGCEGGLMDDAFEYVKLNNGIDTEDCYPYDGQDKTCRYKSSCVGATLTGHVDVEHGDEDALKKAIATAGPVSIAIDAGHPSFQRYSHGVYDEPDCSSEQLDHGVLCVGYGRHLGHVNKEYWIVKNSWGESWGLHGYIHMSRNKDNQCGVASQASYPLV